MLTETIRQHYQMLRATGHHAKYALEAAKKYSGREPSKFAGLGFMTRPKTVEIDGFTVTAKVESDDYGDISDLGEFCMAKSGAISRNPSKVGRGDYTHFLPANPEYGKQDLKRAEAYGNDWFYTFVVVTVYKQGIELASDSLGGIESDSDDDYWAEVADDCADEAISEAKEVLAKLCAS